MYPVIAKTFGGLSLNYYLRQLVLCSLFSAFLIYITIKDPGQQSLQFGTIALLILNTLLYPYARFAYACIIDFVLGRAVFFVNAILLILTKFITIALCWSAAIFIAPIGLAYLYFYHSKTITTN